MQAKEGPAADPAAPMHNGSMRHSPSNATETIQEVRKDAYRTQPHRAADTVQA